MKMLHPQGGRTLTPEVLAACSPFLPKRAIRKGMGWGGGEKSNFTVEKPDNHYLSQGTKVKIHSDAMLTAYTRDTI